MITGRSNFYDHWKIQFLYVARKNTHVAYLDLLSLETKVLRGTHSHYITLIHTYICLSLKTYRLTHPKVLLALGVRIDLCMMSVRAQNQTLAVSKCQRYSIRLRALASPMSRFLLPLTTLATRQPGHTTVPLFTIIPAIFPTKNRLVTNTRS